MDQWPPHGRGFLRDTIRLLQQILCAAEPGVRVVTDGAEWFALLDRVANFLVQYEAHCGIDRVFFLFAAAAEHQAGNSHLFALDKIDEPAR